MDTADKFALATHYIGRKTNGYCNSSPIPYSSSLGHSWLYLKRIKKNHWPKSRASAPTWLIRYIYYWNSVPIPCKSPSDTDFAYPVYILWFISQALVCINLSLLFTLILKDKKIHEARVFNFTYRYIDDVLSINNSRFAEFLPLIYPPELEVRDHRYSFVRIIFGLIPRIWRQWSTQY
jgi:hypothetical protein